jgi:hypothetical protein
MTSASSLKINMIIKALLVALLSVATIGSAQAAFAAVDLPGLGKSDPPNRGYAGSEVSAYLYSGRIRRAT